ncbi:hypothetical protein JDS79_35125 [Bacillus cereus]|nr:hypothetical protein [Bacillus cereus]
MDLTIAVRTTVGCADEPRAASFFSVEHPVIAMLRDKVNMMMARCLFMIINPSDRVIIGVVN